MFIASSHNLRGRIETPFRASELRPHLPRRGSCKPNTSLLTEEKPLILTQLQWQEKE